MTGLRFREDDGFSALELMVAIALTTLIGTIVVGSTVRVMTISAATTQRADLLSELQRTAERMTRNVRAADPITAASSTSLSVVVYHDSATAQTVTYDVVGTELQQTVTENGVPGPTITVLDGLDTSVDVLTYTVDDGTVWDGVDPSDIRQVVITLDATSGEQRVNFSTSVFVRNTTAAIR